MPEKQNQQKNDLTYRTMPLVIGERGTPKTLNEDDRSVEVVGTTEDPVEVFDWDKWDIVKETLLMSGMELPETKQVPLLDSHSRYSTSSVIGSYRDLAVKKDSLIGRAVFSSVGTVEDIYTKVREGHLTDFSVGYRVLESTWIPEGQKAVVAGRSFTGPLKVTSKWRLKELSVVPIGADERAKARQDSISTIQIKQEANIMPEVNEKEFEAIRAQVRKDLEKEYQAKNREEAERASRESTDRVRNIIAMGDEFKMADDAARFLKDGKSYDDFRTFVLDKLKARGVTPVKEADPELGLTQKEKRGYSFLNVIRMLSHPGDAGFQKAAGFEIECSRAVENLSRKTPKGLFVPTDVLRHDYKRDMATSSGSTGGYLVDNILAVGSFIEMLENTMVTRQAGAMILRDLVGDLSIPKQTGGATAYWIGEGDDITESQQALGQVALRPKSVGAFTDLTRKFMLQSSIDAETFVRSDLALRLALAIDLAALWGTGASNQPLGIGNTTGIGSVTFNAQNAPDWGDIVDMETALATDNALVGNMAYIFTPTIIGNMKQTPKVSAQAIFLIENGMANGYRVYSTKQMTALYGMFGNWRDLVIGEWSGVDVNVDTATLSKSGGVRVVVIQDVDVAVRHAESFALGYHS